MMPDVTPVSTPKRWPRGQKFALTAAGALAEASHREAVNSARASGRNALDLALAAWSGPLGILPGDGVVLSELAGKLRGLNDLAEALADTGIAPADVKATVDRLVVARLAEPVAPTSRP